MVSFEQLSESGAVANDSVFLHRVLFYGHHFDVESVDRDDGVDVR